MIDFSGFHLPFADADLIKAVAKIVSVLGGYFVLRFSIFYFFDFVSIMYKALRVKHVSRSWAVKEGFEIMKRRKNWSRWT